MLPARAGDRQGPFFFLFFLILKTAPNGLTDNLDHPVRTFWYFKMSTAEC